MGSDALPSWTAFNSSFSKLTGVPVDGDVGEKYIQVSALCRQKKTGECVAYSDVFQIRVKKSKKKSKSTGDSRSSTADVSKDTACSENLGGTYVNLVLDGSLDNLGASQRIEIISTISNFVRISVYKIHLRKFRASNEVLGTGRKHVVAAGPGNTDSDREDFIEVSWNVACGPFKELKNLVKVIQHNVEGGRFTSELGFGILGWYITSFSSLPAPEARNKRRAVRATVMPTPVLTQSPPTKVPTEVVPTIKTDLLSSVSRARHSKTYTSHSETPVIFSLDKSHEDRYHTTSESRYTDSATPSLPLYVFSSSSLKQDISSTLYKVRSSASEFFRSSEILSTSDHTVDIAYTPTFDSSPSSSIYKPEAEKGSDSSTIARDLDTSTTLHPTPDHTDVDVLKTYSSDIRKYSPEQTFDVVGTVNPSKTEVILPTSSLLLPDDKSVEKETDASGSGMGEIEDDEDFFESEESPYIHPHSTSTIYPSYPIIDTDSTSSSRDSIDPLVTSSFYVLEPESSSMGHVPTKSAHVQWTTTPIITSPMRQRPVSEVSSTFLVDQSSIVPTHFTKDTELGIKTHPSYVSTKDVYTSHSSLPYPIGPTKFTHVASDVRPRFTDTTEYDATRTPYLFVTPSSTPTVAIVPPDLDGASGSGSGDGSDEHDDDDFIFTDQSSSFYLLYPSEAEPTQVYHTKYETFQLPTDEYVSSDIFEDTHEVYFQESPTVILKESLTSRVKEDSSFIIQLSTTSTTQSVSQSASHYLYDESSTTTQTETSSLVAIPGPFDESVHTDMVTSEMIQSSLTGFSSTRTTQPPVHTATSKTYVYPSDSIESDDDYLGSGSGSGSGSGAGSSNDAEGDNVEFFFDDSSIYSDLHTTKINIIGYSVEGSPDFATPTYATKSRDDSHGIFQTGDLSSSFYSGYLKSTPSLGSVKTLSTSSVSSSKVELSASDLYSPVVHTKSVISVTTVAPEMPSGESGIQSSATESREDTSEYTTPWIIAVTSTGVVDEDDYWINPPSTHHDDDIIRPNTPPTSSEGQAAQTTDHMEASEPITTQSTDDTAQNNTPWVIADTELLVQDFRVVAQSPTEVELSWKPPAKEGLHSFVLTYQRERNRPNEREFIRIPAYRKVFHVVNLDADTGYYFNISAQFDDGKISQPVHLHATTPSGEIKNFAPRPVNKIGELTAKVGEKFEYRLPDNTFQDEDGNINDLRVSVRLPHKLNLPRDFWLQFNTRTKTLYGLPLPYDVKGEPYKFLIAASDSRGETTIDSFKIGLNASRTDDELEPQTHRIYLTLSGSYRKFTASRKNAILLIGRIASYFGDSDPRYMTIVDIRKGSVVVVWSNNTLNGNKCQNESISTLYYNLVDSDGQPKEEFSDHLGSQFKVQSVTLKPLGPCSSAPVVPKASTDFDIWAAVVLPAIIAVVVLLLIIIIMLVVYWKCARNRRRPDTPNEFKRRTKPVILPDEIDYDDPSLRPQRPLILPSDESNGTSNDGRDSTPNGVPAPQYPRNGYTALENRNGVNNGRGPKPPAYRPPRELPPAYRLPPPYTPNQGSSEV